MNSKSRITLVMMTVRITVPYDYTNAQLEAASAELDTLDIAERMQNAIGNLIGDPQRKKLVDLKVEVHE